MKTWFWGGVHNCVAHPLMWLFFEMDWTDRFHNWTAKNAWPVKD